MSTTDAIQTKPSLASLTRRESHFSLQRSSLPPSRPGSRPSSWRNDGRSRSRQHSLTQDLPGSASQSRQHSLTQDMLTNNSTMWIGDGSIRSFKAYADEPSSSSPRGRGQSWRSSDGMMRDEFSLGDGYGPSSPLTPIYGYDADAAPAPSVGTKFSKRRNSFDSIPSAKRTHIRSHSDRPRTQPNDDGAAAPPPSFLRHKSRSKPNLRDTPTKTTTRTSHEEDLTEVAAPPPVSRGPDRGEHLESDISEAREEKALGPTKTSALEYFYIISYLITFSMLGTLARLGMQRLTTYPNAPSTFPVLWPNFAGSLIMGFLSEDQYIFRPCTPSVLNPDPGAAKAAHNKYKKTIPLFVGLTTGFCGSLTSFSSFMRDVFLALSNDLPSPHSPQGTIHRNGGYSFEALLAVTILTICLSLSALKLGAHFALLLSNTLPVPSLTRSLRFLNPVFAVLGPAMWIVVIVLCAVPPSSDKNWRGQALFALLFAPLGCLARWYASLRLNPLFPSFPMGTFAVNVFGTAVLGMSYDLQHVSLGAVRGGGMLGCQVLQGIMDGFCGCLTTVSTWVLELSTLGRRHAWLYGSASWAVALGVVVVVMGSVRWGSGWGDVVCATGW